MRFELFWSASTVYSLQTKSVLCNLLTTKKRIGWIHGVSPTLTWRFTDQGETLMVDRARRADHRWLTGFRGRSKYKKSRFCVKKHMRFLVAIDVLFANARRWSYNSRSYISVLRFRRGIFWDDPPMICRVVRVKKWPPIPHRRMKSAWRLF